VNLVGSPAAVLVVVQVEVLLQLLKAAVDSVV
jgi:hypothetical protein